MNWLAILGLTGDLGAPDAASAPPPAVYAGRFHEAPALTWARPLPGPRVAAATHTELGAPVLEASYIFVGSAADDALLVLDRKDGRLVRRLPAGGPVQAAPVVQGDRIWFSDTAGTTSCYRIDDGHLLWRHEGSSPVLARPLLDDGRITVANVDSVVVSLDASSGELLWRHAWTPDRVDSGPALYGSPPPMPLSGSADLVLTGYSDGTLLALDAHSGELAWQRRVGEGTYPDLIGAIVPVGPNLVAGGFTGPLLALSPDTRAVAWRVEVGSGAAPSLGLPDPETGLPVLYHGGTDGVLRAIDARTGEVRWTWDSETQGSLTAPVVTEGGLLVGSSAGGLYLVDPATGLQSWEFDPGYLLGGVSAIPAVDGRQLVVVSNAGRIYSLVVPEPPGPGDLDDGDHGRVTGPRAPAPRAGGPLGR